MVMFLELLLFLNDKLMEIFLRQLTIRRIFIVSIYDKSKITNRFF